MLREQQETLVPAPRSPEPYSAPAQDVVEKHGFMDEYVLSRDKNPDAKLSLFGVRRPGQIIIEVGPDVFEMRIADDLTVSIGGLRRTMQESRFVRDGDPAITLEENVQTGIVAAGRDRGFVVGTVTGRISFFTDFQGEDVRIMTQTGLLDEEL